MSSQLTSGTVAKPSRLLDGCTSGNAVRKSSMETKSGSICLEVSGAMAALWPFVGTESALNAELSSGAPESATTSS
jgi:hypothetical protein